MYNNYLFVEQQNDAVFIIEIKNPNNGLHYSVLFRDQWFLCARDSDALAGNFFQNVGWKWPRCFSFNLMQF